jgi:gamma-glutamyltranspeptidase/glutathione hydrolase
MLAPVMTMDAGARIYSPGGTLLQPGDRLHQPGLVAALEAVAAEGAATAYTGVVGEALLALSDERGGLLTPDDLRTYEARWTEPLSVRCLEWTLETRGDLSGIPEAARRWPSVRERTDTERVLALVDVLHTRDAYGDTTNTTVVDGDGNACVLTTSLGLGSGDFLPGLDLHLNSMLGEADLVRGSLVPGSRMQSMMAPTLAFDRNGRLDVAVGAAGGTRLRTALMGATMGILDEELAADVAVARPRFHPAGSTINAEPGVDDAALAMLEEEGWAVRRWAAQHHYFGGVSVVSRRGAAADPRRDGAVASPAAR